MADSTCLCLATDICMRCARVVSAPLEVRALVMAVQQPLAECTAIFIVCIVKHHPPPCAVTIHETCTDQQWNGFQNSARIQDQRSMCCQQTKHYDLSQ